MKAAAEYLTPVVLELGGKNPVWVDPSADIHRTARSIIWAKTTNTGKLRLSSPDTELDSVGLTDDPLNHEFDSWLLLDGLF